MAAAVGIDQIDLEPLPALACAGSGHPGTAPRMFHGDEDSMLVAAQTDSEIARAYLYHAGLAPPTLKSTKTELGRFLLWCQASKLTLRDLRVEDLTSYKNWLLDPQPASQWVSTTRWPRTDSRWRPFSGPLSDSSARQSFRVVKSLLTFATNTGYLQRNAGVLVKNLKTSRDARVTRYLSVSAIDFVYAAIVALPARTSAARKAQARAQFLFLAYITTGARLSEIVTATMGAIYTEGDGRWWIDVIGKGAKPRRLPVSPALRDAFCRYRAVYGLALGAVRADLTPLVLSTRAGPPASVTDQAASKVIKRAFALAAARADTAGDPDAAASLREASTHWLRHTMLTTHANNGVALKTLQDTAGHVSLATTSTYLHKSDKERHDELMASLGDVPPPK